jgi:hypothetical protein
MLLTALLGSGFQWLKFLFLEGPKEFPVSATGPL